MGDEIPSKRRLFHSFPRPKKDEAQADTLERALKILAAMKHVGLILAPEIVNWNVSVLSPTAPPVNLLQRRASFTELDVSELPAHSAIFGPISLSCEITKLRNAGAIPVIYVPQGTVTSPLSTIATFSVNGIYHTKGVLTHLHDMNQASDPVALAQQLGRPVSPDCVINLNNTGPGGEIVAHYSVRMSDLKNVLQYVGFNNIPFDHSAAVLGFLLNLFYPADNTHQDDELGYYRQREWRLTASDIAIKRRPIARKLSDPEMLLLEKVDPEFWTRELMVDGVPQRRSALALIYDPTPGWDFFELVDEILVPEDAVDRVRAIAGAGTLVRGLG
jgi:hypothetical protein